MIDFEQAKQIALACIGPECGLLEDYTLEKPYGWYFSYQSLEYIRIQDWKLQLFGGTHFIVERDGGKIIPLGSTYSTETYLDAYEKGFKYERYDLTITAVRNRETTIRFLYSLNMSRIVVEVVGGQERQDYKRYGQIIIDGLLRKLPCVFRDQRFGAGNYKVFEEITASGCCTYELCEHQPAELPKS